MKNKKNKHLFAGIALMTSVLLFPMVSAAEEAEMNRDSGIEVLLIGSDRKDDSWNGNSDSMILISVSPEKEQIGMVSFMRDLGVTVPGQGHHKLNYAMAYGGEDLLVETINENFDLNIEKYVSVDLVSMCNVVDALGGIEITFTDGEAEVANYGINEMENILGEDLSEYKFSSGGTYWCNGYQAVSYARVRKVGNADYQRTERQREVLTKLTDKLKELTPTEKVQFMSEVLPQVSHNFSITELADILKVAETWMEYEFVEDRIPYDDLYYSEGGNLIPKMEETIERLHNMLYTEE